MYKRGRRVFLLVSVLLLIGITVIVITGDQGKVIAIPQPQIPFLLQTPKNKAEEAFYSRAVQLADDLKATEPQLGSEILDTRSNFDTQIVLGTEESLSNAFDPRFTFGLILNDISKSKDLNNVELQYFHWGDWTDISHLDDKVVKKDKRECSSFKLILKGKQSEIVEPTTFCFNHKDIPKLLADPELDESFKKRVERARDLPDPSNFHIFQNGGRSSMSNKIIQGKAYLNEFMPPPLSILLLVPDKDFSNPRGIKVSVNQNLSNQKRLKDTPLMQNYIDQYQGSSPVILDVSEQLQALKVDALHTNPVEMPVQLSPQSFVDKSQEILAGFSDNDGELTSIHDKRYMESLKYSLHCEAPPKYFYEAKLIKTENKWPLGAHYDWRFFNGLMHESENLKPVISNLLASWFELTQTYQLTTWVAHGSLLSWYWNGGSFPWDNDIDVQMPIADLHKLSHQFNQTIIVDMGGNDGDQIRYGRYFLDCGTFISHRSRGNGHNNIDARFIDMDTGLYIDITALAASDTLAPNRYAKLGGDTKFPLSMERNQKLNLYNCRNNHFAQLNQISPLTLTYVEGMPAYIPHDYLSLLVTEYQEKSVIEKSFNAMIFIKKLQLWIPKKIIQLFLSKNPEYPQMLVESNQLTRLETREFDHFLTWKDEHFLKFLQYNPTILAEYLVTRNVTAFHREEIKRLESLDGGQSLSNEVKRKFPRLRSDLWNILNKKKQIKKLDKVTDVRG